MEDLLASIRKAIHDDIGDGRALGAGRTSFGTQTAPPQPRVGDELAAAAAEIQQLREKISRARAGKPLPPVEPAQRAASLAAALKNETPRRNWRDIEPAPLPPRLRGTVVETDPPRVAARVEVAPPRLDVPAPQAGTPRDTAAPMLSGNSAQAVQSAFNKLAESVLSRAVNDRSVEDITRELLRVMLKQWLDENLPEIVERMVREEIERVARSAR